jgi:hypothetical protein
LLLGRVGVVEMMTINHRHPRPSLRDRLLVWIMVMVMVMVMISSNLGCFVSL